MIRTTAAACGLFVLQLVMVVGFALTLALLAVETPWMRADTDAEFAFGVLGSVMTPLAFGVWCGLTFDRWPTALAGASAIFAFVANVTFVRAFADIPLEAAGTPFGVTLLLGHWATAALVIVTLGLLVIPGIAVGRHGRTALAEAALRRNARRLARWRAGAA